MWVPFREQIIGGLMRLVKWIGGPDMFELAFEHASIGMALVGTDGKWLKINHALELILERPEDEILAHTFQDYTPQEGGLQDDLRFLRECLVGDRKGYVMPKAYLMPDGRLKHVRLAVSMVRLGNRPLFFISQITDIDGEVRMAEQLEQALQRERETKEALQREVKLLRKGSNGSLARELDTILKAMEQANGRA